MLLCNPLDQDPRTRRGSFTSRSLSDLVREILGEYLVERTEDARLQRELEALDELRQIRERIEQRYGVYQGDLLAEVRAERDRQLTEAQNEEQQL